MIQHNEARDLMADCMREARFSAVEEEPKLQRLTGATFEHESAIKDDEARSAKWWYVVVCWDCSNPARSTFCRGGFNRFNLDGGSSFFDFN